MTRRFDRLAMAKSAHAIARAPSPISISTGRRLLLRAGAVIIRRLDLPMAAVEEQFRRMAFNIIARNQDDHVKNIAFLMDGPATGVLAGLRHHLQPQSGRRLDPPPSDVDERQARRFHARRLSGLRQSCANETRYSAQAITSKTSPPPYQTGRNTLNKPRS